MSYEEYVNEEALELTEETAEPAETTEPAETEAEVVAETVAEESIEAAEPAEVVVTAEETDAAEPVAEEPVAVEEEVVAPVAEDEDYVIQYSVEEPLEMPEVDEALFDAAVADEEFDFAVEDEEQPCDPLQTKCDEVRMACKDVVQRISKDLKETNYNPYIRSTTTYRYEIMKKSTDTEPIDVFEFQRTSGFSLRAMAITTVLVAAADVAVGKFLKKKLKK